MMSEKPENNNSEDLFESTVFSNPTEFNDSRPNSHHPLLKRVLAALLCVCFLAGVTIAVVRLIPETEKQDTETQNNPVVSIETSSVSKVEIKNPTCEMVLLNSNKKTSDDTDGAWSIEGIDPSLTQSTLIENTVLSVTKLDYIKIFDDSEADYGFDQPTVEAVVYPRDNSFEQLTVTIGAAAPANLGYYCKISSDSRVFLVSNDPVTLLSVEPLYFADTTGYPAIKQNAENASCFSDNSIIDFDSLTISGKNFSEKIKIIPQKDESINSYFAYLLTSPSERIGNDTTVEEVLTLFSGGIASQGAYAYNPTADDLKKYSLDNPDIVITLSLASKSYTIKASVVDDLYCAMLDDSENMIHKIPLSVFGTINSKPSDFYSTFIFLENLSGLNKFTVEISGSEKYVFDLSYTEEGSIYQAFFEGKELDSASFKDYYGKLISLAPISYESAQINRTSLKITLSHTDGTKDTVLEFKEFSSQRYQVEMNSIPMGLITATDYQNLINYTRSVSGKLKTN